MSRKLDNYLKTYRKHSGLSQLEVGFLLGGADGQRVSAYECRIRRPNLETLLAYEKILGIPPRELFSGVAEKVDKKIVQRAQLLAEKLNTCDPTPLMKRKLARLAAINSGPTTGTYVNPT